MFIRTKKLRNRKYAYLVENKWVNNQSKQKIISYLGPVIELGNQEVSLDHSLKPFDRIKKAINQIILSIEGVSISKKKMLIKQHKKKVVISLNGGFLCDYTIKNVLKSLNNPDSEKAGEALAISLANAGIKISKEDFIKLYMDL